MKANITSHRGSTERFLDAVKVGTTKHGDFALALAQARVSPDGAQASTLMIGLGSRFATQKESQGDFEKRGTNLLMFFAALKEVGLAE